MRRKKRRQQEEVRIVTDGVKHGRQDEGQQADMNAFGEIGQLFRLDDLVGLSMNFGRARHARPQ